MNSLKLLTFIFFVLFSFELLSQDERLYNELLIGKIEKDIVPEKDFKFLAKSPDYKIDLDNNGLLESIKVIKGDGENLITVKDNNGREIFSGKMQALGYDSSLYRIDLYKLSPSKKILVLHFYEGITKHINFDATASLYFISFDHDDLKTLSLYKGPSIWLEREREKRNYDRRKYTLHIEDYNKDGIRDIAIKHKKMSQVYFYLGKGKWRNI